MGSYSPREQAASGIKSDETNKTEQMNRKNMAMSKLLSRESDIRVNVKRSSSLLTFQCQLPISKQKISVSFLANQRTSSYDRYSET